MTCDGMSLLINQSVNYEVVCRAAPATPGLLITLLIVSGAILRSKRKQPGLLWAKERKPGGEVNTSGILEGGGRDRRGWGK